MFLSRNIPSAEQGLSSCIQGLPILLDITGFAPETPGIPKIWGKRLQCHN